MPEAEQVPISNFRFLLFVAEKALSPEATATSLRRLADGAFAEVTGLEATMEAKVIKEGGLNYGAHQRVGPVSFATVVLRRGMTRNEDLLRWFYLINGQGAYTHRMDVQIAHLDLDGTTEVRRWHLDRALPVKFKSSDLNAKGAEIAIEELHLVHEGLKRV
jgi:phage tail-like protein